MQYKYENFTDTLSTIGKGKGIESELKVVNIETNIYLLHFRPNFELLLKWGISNID